MSDVQSVLNAISEANEAHKALPRLEARVSELDHINNELHRSIQDREMSILNYKNDIQELTNKLLKVEAERDEALASFRSANASLNVVAGDLRDVIGLMRSTLDVVDPPKPEPVEQTAEPVKPAEVEHIPQFLPSSSPTPESGWNTPATQAADLTPSSQKPAKPAERSGPYVGKHYFRDIAGTVGRADWLNGGGTEYGYEYHDEIDNSRL
jgi:uncharacterized coiled-coil protein SlyX